MGDRGVTGSGSCLKVNRCSSVVGCGSVLDVDATVALRMAAAEGVSNTGRVYVSKKLGRR